MTNDKQWFNRATVGMTDTVLNGWNRSAQNGQLNITDPINHIHSLNLIQAQ